MGIKSFSAFLCDHAPHATSSVRIDELSVRSVAVDVCVYMHRFAGARGDGDVSVEHCLRRFADMQRAFRRAAIDVLLVFDGPPSQRKRREVERRRLRRERSAATRVAARVPVGCYKALREHCDAARVAYIDAHGDAEKTCAWLCKRGAVDAVVSDDYDALAFGAPLVIRNLRAGTCDVVSLRAIRDALEWDQRMFVIFCTLAGCDFANVKYGPAQALELMKSGTYRYCVPLVGAAIEEFENRPQPLDVSRMSAAARSWNIGDGDIAAAEEAWSAKPRPSE